MEKIRAFYLGIVLLLLLAVDCSFLNLKVNVMAKANSEDVETNGIKVSSEQTGVTNSVSDSNTAEKEKKIKETQLTKPKENIDAGNDNGSKKSNEDEKGQPGARKTGNVEKENGKLKEKEEKPQAVSDDNEKKNVMPKEKGKEGDSKVSVKDPHVEDCDPSNKCIDDQNNFFACLRVPGNDLEYSLLIQNKAKKPLVVAISAPDFVHLEKTEIQLQAEGNQKVKVSIAKGGSESFIDLKAGNGHCKLGIKHLIADLPNDVIDLQKSTFINFMSRTRVIIILPFAALLLLAAGWAFVSFRKKQLSAASGAKYRRLDADLPVSGGGKESDENNEGWDDSWGDDWDDEEAPKTPSMPLTPSLSSKGLASRRLVKDAWKD